MKRFLVLCFSLFVLYLSILPGFAALGDVHTVQSPLARPEVSAVTSGSSTTYTCAFMRQTEAGPSNEAPAGSYLSIVTFTIPSSMDVVFYPRNYNSWFLWVAAPIYYEINEYDIETGAFREHYSRSSATYPNPPDSVNTYFISPREGYYPSQTVYNSHLLGAYWYLPSEIQIKSGSSQGYYADWVQWSVAPIESTQLHSFTSEPVYDYLNRYIILAGASDGYIYHLSYYAPVLSEYEESDPAFWGLVSSDYFFAPQLTLSDFGLSLSLYVNSDLLTMWENGYDGGILSTYDLLITKYKLSDGQYVSSSLFTGYVAQSTTLNYSFGSVSDFTQVKTYGVHYLDNSTSRHFNFLSCIWEYDPDFVTWQNSISSSLNSILSVLRGDDQPTGLPVDSDVAQNVDEYVSGEADILGRMDSVDSGLDNIFSDANSDLSSNSAGFSFIKYLIETFVLGISPIYIVVFFSLTFGLIVLIIGRSLR